MRHGGILLATAAILACSACLGSGGKLEIRAVDRGLKAGSQPVPFRIAEARGHLALGNVALALEGFRKAAREDPASIEALAGMADCYDRMARFDLSRRYYEMALAVAPRDQRLLALFAGSLDQQGKASEAASVRAEMAALAEQTVSPAPAAPEPVEEPTDAAVAAAAPPTLAVPAPVGQSVTIALPPSPPPELVAPAPVGQSVTIALPTPRAADAPKATAAPARAMAVAPVGRSVTIALPPPRPATAARPPERAIAAPVSAHRQPRLERVSLTEVALITGNGPRWRRPEAESPRMATGPALPARLRVLNAARVDKLAARTRTYLGRFGWRSVTIGDAAVVRPRSLIVYPAGQRALASKLSAQTGVASAERSDVRMVTMLLGRDAARHPALR